LCLHNLRTFLIDIRKAIRRFLLLQIKNDSHFVNETSLKQRLALFLWKVQVKKFIVDNHTYLVCFFRNISDRKKVEANLNMLSLAASETTVTIIIANSQGKAIWANNAYLELTGLSLEEVIDNRPGTMSKTGDRYRSYSQN
jgi:PAS domain-containing protein